MARNFHLPPPQAGLRPRPDLDALLAPQETRLGKERLRRWSTRIAEEVACEIEAIARLKSVSVNALVMIALDRLLKEHGRPAISELAPWFPDYLMRQGGTLRDKEPPPRGEFD
jgi:hypothetical protein